MSYEAKFQEMLTVWHTSFDVWWDAYVGLPIDKRTSTARDVLGRRMNAIYANRAKFFSVFKTIEDAGGTLKNPEKIQNIILECAQLTTVSDEVVVSYHRSRLSSKVDTTPLARYIQMHYDIPDHVVRDIASAEIAKIKGSFEITNDIDMMVEYVRVGPQTCMKKFYESDHPIRAYDPSLGWGMCVRKKGDTIVGRAITLTTPSGSKVYVRSYKAYGDNPSSNNTSHTDEALDGYLNGLGYTKLSSWPEGSLVMPYKLDDTSGVLSKANPLLDFPLRVPYLDGDVKKAAITDSGLLAITSTKPTIELDNANALSSITARASCTSCGDPVFSNLIAGSPPSTSTKDRWLCSNCQSSSVYVYYGADNVVSAKKNRISEITQYELVTPIVGVHTPESAYYDQPSMEQVAITCSHIVERAVDGVTYSRINSGVHKNKVDVKSKIIRTRNGHTFHVDDIGTTIVNLVAHTGKDEYVTKQVYDRMYMSLQTYKVIVDNTKASIVQLKKDVRSKKSLAELRSRKVCSDEVFDVFVQSVLDRNLTQPCLGTLENSVSVFLFHHRTATGRVQLVSGTPLKVESAISNFMVVAPKNSSILTKDERGAWMQSIFEDGNTTTNNSVVRITDDIYMMTGAEFTTAEGTSKIIKTYKTIVKLV